MLVVDGVVIGLSEISNLIAEFFAPIIVVAFFLMVCAYCWGTVRMHDVLPWRLAMLALAIVPAYWMVENLILAAIGYTQLGAELATFGHKWQYGRVGRPSSSWRWVCAGGGSTMRDCWMKNITRKTGETLVGFRRGRPISSTLTF
jgi:hypothetical protein